MIAQRVVDCGFQDQVFTIFDVLHGDFSADTGVSPSQLLSANSRSCLYAWHRVESVAVM